MTYRLHVEGELLHGLAGHQDHPVADRLQALRGLRRRGEVEAVVPALVAILLGNRVPAIADHVE